MKLGCRPWRWSARHLVVGKNPHGTGIQICEVGGVWLGLLRGLHETGSESVLPAAKGQFRETFQEEEGANVSSPVLSSRFPLASLTGRSQVMKEKCVLQSVSPSITEQSTEWWVGKRGRSSASATFQAFARSPWHIPYHMELNFQKGRTSLYLSLIRFNHLSHKQKFYCHVPRKKRHKAPKPMFPSLGKGHGIHPWAMLTILIIQSQSHQDILQHKH